MKTLSSDKKSIMAELKSELVSVVVILFSFLLIFKIVLYKESIAVLFLFVLKLFYSVIVPGLFISSYLHKKISFTTRLVLGSVFTIALISIMSYYLGLVGLHVKYHPFILPPLIMLSGVLLFLKNRRT